MNGDLFMCFSPSISFFSIQHWWNSKRRVLILNIKDIFLALLPITVKSWRVAGGLEVDWKMLLINVCIDIWLNFFASFTAYWSSKHEMVVLCNFRWWGSLYAKIKHTSLYIHLLTRWIWCHSWREEEKNPPNQFFAQYIYDSEEDEITKKGFSFT